jgi:hypothetical protein
MFLLQADSATVIRTSATVPTRTAFATTPTAQARNARQEPAMWSQGSAFRSLSCARTCRARSQPGAMSKMAALIPILYARVCGVAQTRVQYRTLAHRHSHHALPPQLTRARAHTHQ